MTNDDVTAPMAEARSQSLEAMVTGTTGPDVDEVAELNEVMRGGLIETTTDPASVARRLGELSSPEITWRTGLRAIGESTAGFVLLGSESDARGRLPMRGWVVGASESDGVLIWAFPGGRPFSAEPGAIPATNDRQEVLSWEEATAAVGRAEQLYDSRDFEQIRDLFSEDASMTYNGRVVARGYDELDRFQRQTLGAGGPIRKRLVGVAPGLLAVHTNEHLLELWELRAGRVQVWHNLMPAAAPVET